MEIRRTYGVATTVETPMLDVSNPETFLTGLTVGDEAYYNDGAGWVPWVIADDFAEIGATGQYSIDLTGAEMQHELMSIKCTAAGSADTLIMLSTVAGGDFLAIRNMIIEQNGSITLQQSLSLLLAVSAGITSGGGLTFQDPSGTSTRVVATVDTDSNRTSITITPSA